MGTIDYKGIEFNVEIERDDYAELPWEFCDCYGIVRRDSTPHWHRESGKLPSERPMNKPDRNEYQFYYDWKKTLEKAKAEGWDCFPYGQKDGYIRAVEADYKRLCSFLNGDWCYVSVTVSDEETGESASLGMVESDYADEIVQELAEELWHTVKAEKRFADAMKCGI